MAETRIGDVFGNVIPAIISGVCLPFGILIVYWTFAGMKTEEMNNDKQINPIIQVTTKVSVIGFTLQNLVWTIVYAGMSRPSFELGWCHFLHSSVWPLSIGKIAMYCYFIGRLHTVFSESAYKIRPTILIIVAVYCIISTFMLNVMAMVSTFFLISHLPPHMMATPIECFTVFYRIDATLEAIVVFGTTLNDIMISVSLLVVFVRKLRQVLKKSAADEKIAAVVRKNTVLVFSSAVSTWAVFVAYGLTGLNVIGVDCLVNACCVAMSLKALEYQYARYCGCCAKWVSCCCECNAQRGEFVADATQTSSVSPRSSSNRFSSTNSTHVKSMSLESN